MAIKENDNREKWLVQNVTNKRISIGDLPLVPVFQPGQCLDILQYEDKHRINQSKNLISVIELGYFTLNKKKGNVNDIIDAEDAADAVTTAEENEINSINEVSEGEEITDDTEGILIFGKDPDGTAQPIGISGEENNEVLTMNLDITTLLEEIYIELIKANIQMAIITGNEIKNIEIKLPTE